ncbi:uncharacterized protein LOC122083288 [Macadamia integrifolia]|uniref:uncharacterized protein LOC122083288 n=1 Tax=Macadamia integrifolia TaxID=60698 RepID=UPI001C4EDFBD|nr:uncharacterized protein LOC122083288 [Macadamia integrifolia]
MGKLLGFSMTLLMSLTFHVILTLFGSFRKRCSKKWFTFLLWSTYQFADIAATIGLGFLIKLSDRTAYDNNTYVDPTWSSFLLLHLGGPDSITAISLVDNELCFRHSLQLLYRVGVSVYIYIKAFYPIFEESLGDLWQLTNSLAPSMLMLLAGISKYGERTWALHKANMATIRDSMLPPPKLGPRPSITNDDDVGDAQSSIRMDVDEYASGMVVPAVPVPAPPPATKPEPAPAPAPTTLSENQLDSDSEEAILLQGHHYFCSFRCLFVDLIVPGSCITDTQITLFLRYSYEVAFQLIDLELRFMYDTLFTKTPVIRTYLACGLRILRISVLLFYLIVTIVGKWVADSVVDIISFNLVCWALVQEMFEVFQMLLSEWTVVWMNNHHNLKWLSRIILKLILSCRLFVSKINITNICGVKGVASETATRWWYNNSMAQYNLLSFCFKDEPIIMFKGLLHLSSWGKSIHEWIENRRNVSYICVPNDSKDFIYQQFKEKVQSLSEKISSAEFRNPRGRWVMKMNNCLEELGWSVDVGFDQSIFIWLVATDLCYYDEDRDSNECREVATQVQVSKTLSNYLLYLLLILPFMMNSKNIGKVMFQDTCVTIKKLFDVPENQIQEKISSLDEKQAQASIKKFLSLDAQILIRDDEANESKSVLLEAHKLAKLLQLYEKEERWKIISGVWVEMLSYAASNCSGKHHAQRLCDGGEFLTKIWLLMAHLGMTQ